MTSEEQVQAMVACADEWGGVDVMFNNAGIMHDEVYIPVSVFEWPWILRLMAQF